MVRTRPEGAGPLYVTESESEAEETETEDTATLRDGAPKDEIERTTRQVSDIQKEFSVAVTIRRHAGEALKTAPLMPPRPKTVTLTLPVAAALVANVELSVATFTEKRPMSEAV